MEPLVSKYIKNLNKAYTVRNATEHTYRIYLQELLDGLFDDKKVTVTNEPKHVRNVGAPDYSITYKSFAKDDTKNNILIGYIEAKDIGKDLSSKQYNNQFTRYKNSCDNLIITDYMTFELYRNKKLATSLSVCELVNNKIVPLPKNFNTFITMVSNFRNFRGITIKSAEVLAEMMAAKAQMLRDTIEKSLEDTIEENKRNKTIHTQLRIFKNNLIHDITKKQFADVYAQTVAYGMLTARIHDDTLDDFSRQEAASLIPQSNPFLRGLFDYISGTNIDDRIEWIVDSLADTFRATDVNELIKDFTKKTGHDDPLIHFYETFLGKYDPKLKKSRGVWYTPKSIVDFIVRACDDILKNEFNIEDGLTDESKIKIKVDDLDAGYTKSGKKRQKEIEIHKVQILDPATGTGTFLAETMKLIRKNFIGQESLWIDYVENDLKPRLNGFEILMASYAMAHFKLDLIYQDTIAKAYKNKMPENLERFNVFLTNSLEKASETNRDLFTDWITDESLLSNKVKSQTPIMVVMGNPPYSGESSNKNVFITKLMSEYKKEYDGSKLKEKNGKWLNDDYVKFIRYSESHIQKNGEGILAFITNHSYLDNPTFRGMRFHLLNTFDKIYIIDLHGNSKKKEVCPDGSKDENVFDIMQGVAIIIGIKKKTKSKKLAELYICDIYGERDFKYQTLNKNSLRSLSFETIAYMKPQFYFVKKDFKLQEIYNKGINVRSLFPINSVGIVTARDKFTIKDSKEMVEKQIIDFVNLEVEEARIKYQLGKDVRDWKVDLAQKDLLDSNVDINNIVPIDYRPFDVKYTYYTGKSKGYLCMPRGQVMKHFKNHTVGLLICRQVKSSIEYNHVFITNKIFESCVVSNKTGEINYGCPLYLYPDNDSLETKRTPNLNPKIVGDIEKSLNLKFISEKEDNKTTFAPIDILDYIYAVLYSPKYREKYKEFLKIDFPRVPYPNTKTFWELVSLGSQLREVHLMENQKLNHQIVTLMGSGTSEISNSLNKKDVKINDDGIVTLSINDTMQIDNIPLVAWNLYIGGYQPAQKWLKDRRKRTLNRRDFKHYNKIIVALVETDKLMKEVDLVIDI